MNSQIEQALIQLHQLLSAIKGQWIIIGTSSLLLGGYDVQPNDIDILADEKTAEEINTLLKTYQKPLQLKDEGKFRSIFGRYLINGVSVELMGDLQVNTQQGWVNLLPIIKQPQNVLLHGLSFTIPSKEDQISIYTLFGRPKDEATLELLHTK